MKLGTICSMAAVCLLYAPQTVGAISLDVNSDDSIKQAAKIIAQDLMQYYKGNLPGQIPGLLFPPYYWWQSGAMWGSMIDYVHYTGDTSYNDLIVQGMQFQVGDHDDFRPRNATASLGNDDQCFWGMSAMTAAETNFQNPASNQPSWLGLAQAVFNSQVPDWNKDDTCGGGLKWQIYQFNAGYYYKNSISNGCFFNLAARLAAYTGNQTYADWAVKTWNWERAVGLMTPDYQVYDGANEANNCSPIADLTQWTYNSGIFLMGAASMYSQTNDPIWAERVQGLVNASIGFFDNEGIMFEVCEPVNLCKTDQFSFKAYLSRWMAATSKLAPFVHDVLISRLQKSAAAAAAVCTGGVNGTTCGTKWGLVNGTKGFDGIVGVGQQMCALEVVQSLLIKTAPPLLTNNTGGTSVGNPNAGAGSSSVIDDADHRPASTSDKAGAGVLTAAVLLTFLGTLGWMLLGADPTAKEEERDAAVVNEKRASTTSGRRVVSQLTPVARIVSSQETLETAQGTPPVVVAEPERAHTLRKSRVSFLE